MPRNTYAASLAVGIAVLDTCTSASGWLPWPRACGLIIRNGKMLAEVQTVIGYATA